MSEVMDDRFPKMDYEKQKKWVVRIWHGFIDKIDSRRRRQRWQKSDWKALSANSIEYFKMMELAFKYEIYSQVLHNGHIAVELILKSAISKEYNSHLWGHEILNLVSVPIKNIPILNELNRDAQTQIQFNKLYSAWSMQYRYRVRPVNKNEAQIYLNAFEGAYKWTKNKYSL